MRQLSVTAGSAAELWSCMQEGRSLPGQPLRAKTADAQLPPLAGVALLSSTQTTLAFHWQPVDIPGVTYEVLLRMDEREGVSGPIGSWETIYQVRGLLWVHSVQHRPCYVLT